MSMSDTVLRRIDDAVQREVAGELFLVPIRGRLADLQELFVLNETGRWLWERLDGSRTFEQLVIGLGQEFEVGDEEARSDARAFFRQLTKASLVEKSGSAADS